VKITKQAHPTPAGKFSAINSGMPARDRLLQGVPGADRLKRVIHWTDDVDSKTILQKINRVLINEKAARPAYVSALF
jgi:hypothetical protein